MIFALAGTATPPDTLFLMFSEQDVITMREGRTLFVDDRQIGGNRFTRVVTCLSKTDEDSIALLKKSQQINQAIVAPEPRKHESKCSGCGGLIATETMFEGRCIVCWATEAKKFRTASN